MLHMYNYKLFKQNLNIYFTRVYRIDLELCMTANTVVNQRVFHFFKSILKLIGRIFIKSLKLWKVHIISLIDNNLMNQWMMQPSLVTAKPRKYRKCMQYGDFLHRGIGEDSVHLKVFNMYAQQL